LQKDQIKKALADRNGAKEKSGSHQGKCHWKADEHKHNQASKHQGWHPLQGNHCLGFS
jgi:hypothetical protein